MLGQIASDADGAGLGDFLGDTGIFLWKKLKYTLFYAFDSTIDGLPSHVLSHLYGRAELGEAPSEFLSNMMESAGVTHDRVQKTGQMHSLTAEQIYFVGNMLACQLQAMSETAQIFHITKDPKIRLQYAIQELNLSVLGRIAAFENLDDIARIWGEKEWLRSSGSLQIPMDFLYTGLKEKSGEHVVSQIVQHGVPHMVRDALFEVNNAEYGVISPNIFLAHLHHDYGISPQDFIEGLRPAILNSEGATISFLDFPDAFQEAIYAISQKLNSYELTMKYFNGDADITCICNDEVPEWYVSYLQENDGDLSQAREDRPWLTVKDESLWQKSMNSIKKLFNRGDIAILGLIENGSSISAQNDRCG